MKFHHIGIACKSITQEIEVIKRIHDVVDISPIVYDPEQKAEVCVIKLEEGTSIELISGEQVENLIRRRITYYHLCFETDDIDMEIIRLQGLGGLLVSEPKPAILFHNKRIAFLQVSYGLVELVES